MREEPVDGGRWDSAEARAWIPGSRVQGAWFDRFVEECDAASDARWPKAAAGGNDARSQISGELWMALRARMASDRDAGARAAAHVLGATGCRTAFARRASGPSAVWGIWDGPETVHLTLLEVRTGRLGSQPPRLTPVEVARAEEWLDLAWERFGHSPLVPLDLKTRPRVASVGYLGVLLLPERGRWQLHRPDLVAFLATPDLEPQLRDLKSGLDAFHRFGC